MRHYTCAFLPEKARLLPSHLRCHGGMALYGGEGDNDGRDRGGRDTRLFEIELKKDHFAESNQTSTDARGCELQVGLIGGPIQSTVTEIFFLLMGGGLSHQSKKNVGWWRLKEKRWQRLKGKKGSATM